MADPQLQQARPNPLQSQSQSQQQQPAANVGSAQFAAGLGAQTRSTAPSAIGQRAEQFLSGGTAATANTITQAALGGLMLATAINPLSLLVLPALLKGPLRTVLPLPTLTTAIAGVGLASSMAFRPNSTANFVGSMVALGALSSAFSSTKPLQLPKP